jgi:hypothetical protein
MRTLRASRASWIVVLSGFAATLAVADEPARSPAQFVPATGLQFYLEYDGLSAYDAAWKASAAHDILVKNPNGATVLDVERRMLDQLFRLAFKDGKLSGAGFLTLQDHVVSRGFALASIVEDGESSTVIVLNGLGDEGGMGRFEATLRGFLRLGPKGPLPTSSGLRGRNLRAYPVENAEAPIALIPNPFGGPGENVPPTSLTWWREGDSLIVVNGPRLDPFKALAEPDRANKDFGALHKARVSAVLDAIEAKRPALTTHPAYLASITEGCDIAGFEPTGLFFAEAKEGRGVLESLRESLPGVGPVDEFTLLEAIDLNRANRIVGRWGFRGKSLATDLRFSFPDGWKGPLKAPGFARGSLLAVPAESGAFVIGSVDLDRAVERFEPLEGALIAEKLALFSAFRQAIRESSTPELREEVLRHLGPTWSVSTVPAVDQVAGEAGDSAVLVEIRDPEGLDKALGTLVSGINGYFRDRLGDEGGAIGFEKLNGPERGYRLVSPAGLASKLSGKTQPTVLIGRSHLAYALNPEQARAAIAAETKPERRWSPSGEAAKSLEALPATLALLCVGNPRDSFWPEALITFRESAPAFVSKFLNLNNGIGAGSNPPADLLELLGVPKNARAASTRGKELRSLIHPSVLAASVEGQSFRVIAFEALPLGCLGFETTWSPDGAMKVEIRFRPGR